MVDAYVANASLNTSNRALHFVGCILLTCIFKGEVFSLYYFYTAKTDRNLFFFLTAPSLFSVLKVPCKCQMSDV